MKYKGKRSKKGAPAQSLRQLQASKRILSGCVARRSIPTALARGGTLWSKAFRVMAADGRAGPPYQDSARLRWPRQNGRRWPAAVGRASSKRSQEPAAQSPVARTYERRDLALSARQYAVVRAFS